MLPARVGLDHLAVVDRLRPAAVAQRVLRSEAVAHWSFRRVERHILPVACRELDGRYHDCHRLVVLEVDLTALAFGNHVHVELVRKWADAEPLRAVPPTTAAATPSVPLSIRRRVGVASILPRSSAIVSSGLDI